MTSTTRIPGVFSHLRLVALVLAAAAAAVLAGCSEEGRTIQNGLPVPGIAYDVTAYRETTTTADDRVAPIDTFTTTAFMDVRLKIQTVYRNGCEANAELELRLAGPDTQRVYIVTPVARYTADSECNVGTSGDTLRTINVRGLALQWRNTLTPADPVFVQMQVEGEGNPPIVFDIRYDLATVGSDSTLYDIKVEDATTGLALDGALVTVQQYGTPNILGEGTTAGGGRFAFALPAPGAVGEDGERYVVKVSYAGRITLFRAIDFPSLNRRREAIVVRV